jgi:hypothetical protein
MSRIVDVAGRIVASLLILFAIVYAADYIALRYRASRSDSSAAFGSVRMERLYAIPQKNGKIEYEFDARQPEVDVPCVHSLFPHMDHSPCWYLQRNSQKPIPM